MRQVFETKEYFYVCLPEHECMVVIENFQRNFPLVKALQNDAPYFIDGNIIAVNEISSAVIISNSIEQVYLEDLVSHA